MLDAYSSVGMPLMYAHWSYGKRFVRDEVLYRKGYQALAYEIVINSNPCISYCMEEKTMAMQTVVIAHAAFGHNHFFKNNYLFQQWTDAGGILDYLDFAKRYVAGCEELHGVEVVEFDARRGARPDGARSVPLPQSCQAKLAEYERRRREKLERETRSIATYGALCPAPQPRPPVTSARKRRANASDACAYRRRTFSISWRRIAGRCVTGSASFYALYAISRNIFIPSGKQS